MTVQDLIEAAARECGVITFGQALNTVEYANCILSLNALLGQFSVEGLTVYFVVRDAFALTGAASYTFGVGGTFNTARPEKIRGAAVINSGGSMPADVVGPERWSHILDRTVTGAFADMLTCDYAFPLANVYLWPNPTAGTLELFSVKPMAQVAALTDVVVYPPGYERALKFNLAVAIAPELAGSKLSDVTVSEAKESKAALAGINAMALGAPVPPAGNRPQNPPQNEDIEQAEA